MAVLTANIMVLRAAMRAEVMDGADKRMKSSPDSTMTVKVITPMNSSLPSRRQFIYLESGGEGPRPEGSSHPNKDGCSSWEGQPWCIHSRIRCRGNRQRRRTLSAGTCFLLASSRT